MTNAQDQGPTKEKTGVDTVVNEDFRVRRTQSLGVLARSCVSPDIVLATLNARYLHASLGLRYLYANLDELQSRAVMHEFTIQDRPLDLAEKILESAPYIVGLGVYIWNATQSLALVEFLKRLAPNLVIVLGGPEVSHETETQSICQLADYVITGEGDRSFRDLCRALLEKPHGDGLPGPKIVQGIPPDLETLTLPYALYTDEDIAHRLIYVEASRGCPFRCEFCLSALDKSVRTFSLEAFLSSMETLLRRGVNHFKFIDRTFNLNIEISTTILTFFLQRYRPGLFLHFEMIPDRFPDALKAIVTQFPRGSLQFEVGVQSFDNEVNKRISRRQNIEALEANLTFLRDTGVHVHADLIVGLPGEPLEQFAQGFDRLFQLGPQEIQVGILKRLHGAPIDRHSATWDMVYSPHAPYEILKNSCIDFSTMQRLKRFARYWDLVGNSGNFSGVLPLFSNESSMFWGFWDFSAWLYAEARRTSEIALDRLTRYVFNYLTEQREVPHAHVASLLIDDYQRLERRPPDFLESFIENSRSSRRKDATSSQTSPQIPSRQRRHEQRTRINSD